MRIYIIEDDLSVISILEDIIERNSWAASAEIPVRAFQTWRRSWR